MPVHYIWYTMYQNQKRLIEIQLEKIGGMIYAEMDIKCKREEV